MTNVDFISKIKEKTLLGRRSEWVLITICLQEEGIVIRPTEPVFSERISGALSMKVVNNKYLLKNED